MRKGTRKSPFTQLMVSVIPKRPGIYILWNRIGEVLYIGKAEEPNNLYNELKLHFDNKHLISINDIYDFQIEVCQDPGRQQIQLLEDHRKNHGCLPDYNEELSITG